MEFLLPNNDPIISEMCATSPLRDRRIFLNEDIDENSIFKLLYWLNRIEALDKKLNTKEPIEIVLDTGGGDAIGTLATISKIQSMKDNGYHIITTVQTYACSGGFWILISGSERRALKNSKIMVHNILTGSQGRHQDMIDDLEETQAIWVRLKKAVTDYTKITDEKMEELKKCKYDWYFWGDQGLELGVVDKLI